MGQRGANAGNLVGRNAHSDAGSATEYAALILAGDDRPAYAIGDIGIKARLTHIRDFKPSLGGKMRGDDFEQRFAGAVGAQNDFHVEALSVAARATIAAISAKPFGAQAARPTNRPSTSACAIRASPLSGVTEPP